MSIWTRIGQAITGLTADAFSTLVEAVRSLFESDPEIRRQVSFSIAIIALSAKMAKADGVVTRDEVEAFRQIFAIPRKEANNVARLYNLAKQDVSGFAAYARQVRELFPGDDAILEDVMDGLFHIAKADGLIHAREMAFLEAVAAVFGIDAQRFERIRLRHVEPEEGDPYAILEADPGWDDEQLRSHYRELVRRNHPDRMIARGVPEEFVVIANERLAAINRAWANIKRVRGI